MASILLLLCTKPFVDKYINKNNKNSPKTNAYSVIDKEGLVTKDILPSKPGQVKVSEEIWTAISSDNTLIKEGMKVKVLKIDGVKLVVKAN